MKRHTLTRPGTLNHATMQTPFSRPGGSSGGIIGPRSDMARLDVQCSNALQQKSQSKHPFLNRSSNMSSSQSQPSIPHGSLTQLSQNASRFSQSSQPEDFGDQVMTSHLTQWKTLKSQHERQMAEQQKLPSSQIPGFPTAVQRRDASTNRGGSQKLGADNSPSTGGITLLGAQKSTTRPWPQCNVSEDLEQKIGNMEKLRIEEINTLQNLRDDYQTIKTLLEETCFDSKDNRSKVTIQQNSLYKLLKEEEAANRNILTAIKGLEETFREETIKLKQQEDTTKRDMVAEIKSLVDTFREEMLKLMADVKGSLQVIEQRGSTLAVQQRHIVDAIPNVQSVHSKQETQPAPIKIKLDIVDLTCEDDNLAIANPDIVDLGFDLNSSSPFKEPGGQSSMMVRQPFKPRTNEPVFLDSEEEVRQSVRRRLLRAKRKIRKPV